MEKFSNWRDGPTGIHPLLPPKIQSTNIIVSIVSNIIGFALFIIRLPFIVVFTLLLVGSDSLFKKVQLGFASRFLNRFFSIVFGRIVLIALGFNKMDEYTETLSKNRQLSGSLSDVKLNDVILANHTSYVDIIYLAYRYSPTFAVPPNDSVSNTPGYVVPMTLWEALTNAISYQVIPSSKAVSLVGLSKTLKWNGPIVVFVEGATSNGSGLLETNNNLLDGWILASGVHIVGIHYPNLYPIYTSVGSFTLHLIRLASRLSNTIEAMYLSRTNFTAFDKNDTASWYNSLMNCLADLVHARRTQINSHNKLSFVGYWYGYKVNYNKKSN
ncbi:hypothetical protein DFA_11298 [Cavenderia fasciculata]|uniref:Phospholipid/glycerol acyltransferase domain-containing protein n=1 Tax=Cavenderia fasciculata TaxID=261658 RepID=F4QC50_CACFS|nr:uncharacterized protein DFA_11298 [Cavenderia fasciculata]EGG13537.1 hypothetical protein DFA_11298 [Cavenderia fasciculata]|eukprot:XP_004350241.1 hypothetical protein DFA_11298 [Cavenderia fasciculata]